MTVRFAAARSAARSPLARVFARREVASHANDNGSIDPASDLSALEPALRHFAQHGLNAARAAQAAAELALSDGNGAAFDGWLEICRTFDRRMASRLERKSAPPIGEAVEVQRELAPC